MQMQKGQIFNRVPHQSKNYTKLVTVSDRELIFLESELIHFPTSNDQL